MTDKEDFQNIGETTDLRAGQIIQTPIVQEMKKAYLDYAMSVIVARALPDIKDGLKPVQRRIVYAAHRLGVTHNARYSKCAKVVGEVMAKYHPHGDTSIYDTLVRMAQHFSLRYPLIDGQGNFGSIDGDSPAAMRYTECRLEKISNLLLQDIEKETVTFAENYSGECDEPTRLPAVIPNLLMNGALGIAVGMATNIPPHNLSELIDGIITILDKGKVNVTKDEEKTIKAYNLIETKVNISRWEIENTVTLEELIQIIKGPDFPTACTIYDQSETLRYFATGKGKIIIRAKTKIEELKNGRYVINVTEIPYQVNKTTLIEKIADLVRNKKINSIRAIRDESCRGKIKIVIELKRDARPQKTLNYLYRHTQLQNAHNVNMLALVNGEPKLLGIKGFLNEFIKHRRDIIVNRSLYLLKKAREKEHILEGLKKALDFIDEVINLIKKSKDSNEARINLIKRFDLTEIQATAILEMQLKRLAALEREKIENELNEIQSKIKKLTKLLKTPQKIINTIKTELLDIKERFGDKRKTRVIKGKAGKFNEEDLIVNEGTLISITESGYIKRMKPSTYKTQGRGGKGILGMRTKEGDEVSMLRFCQTHDRILFLTNRGRIYEKRVWDIPESSRQSKGTAIVNILDMKTSEKLEEVITLDHQTKKTTQNEQYLLMATKNGQIKKTAISDFENIRKTGIIAIKLKDNDHLVRAKLTGGNNNVILITSFGKSIKFKEANVRPMGRTASGVRGIKLRKDDEVVTMEVIPITKDKTKSNLRLLTLTENGFGKTTKISDYPIQNRGGSGVLTAKTTNKTGKIVVAKIINEGCTDILITSESGQIIRIPMKSLPTSSRATQGVILMRLNREDKVSAVTVFDKDQMEVQKLIHRKETKTLKGK